MSDAYEHWLWFLHAWMESTHTRDIHDFAAPHEATINLFKWIRLKLFASLSCRDDLEHYKKNRGLFNRSLLFAGFAEQLHLLWRRLEDTT